MKLDFTATTRNREPIEAVLRAVLPPSGVVLEIASGSGQHCAWFAQHLPGLEWQPSDPDPAHRASITAWTESLPNVRAPLALDVLDPSWATTAANAIVCCNMIHIAPWAACLGLLRGAADLLARGEVLYLYGPFRVGGAHTAPSNEAFDASLRSRDPSWGVRDLEAVVAAAVGFTLTQTVAMPANNLSLVFVRD
jgi:hypothetical protein